MLVTYDYRCPRCLEIFERFINKKEMDTQVCPKCGCLAKRLMPSPGTTFKFNDK
jgi:putative FmdB family regulatory protein